jgi:hypothetical protein
MITIFSKSAIKAQLFRIPVPSAYHTIVTLLAIALLEGALLAYTFDMYVLATVASVYAAIVAYLGVRHG